MVAYYNEIEKYPSAWLENLSEAGLIAKGTVDNRPIQLVDSKDLTGYAQCHFFAGIGVWSHALRRAGWPDSQPVWTASLPCQPFSVAGEQKGKEDERHLWPVFKKLVEECFPSVIIGEQVSSPSGRAWFADLRSEMEEMGYAVGGIDTCAAGVGAPHIRQRLYWVAYSDKAGSQGHVRLEDDETRRQNADGQDSHDPFWRSAVGVPCISGKSRPHEPSIPLLVDGTSARVGRISAYGNALCAPQAEAFIRAVIVTINNLKGE